MKLLSNKGIKDDIKREVNVKDCLLPKHGVMQQPAHEKKLSFHPSQATVVFPIGSSPGPHHVPAPPNRM